MLDTLLKPMTALIVWTLVMWVWMYATRLPAMTQAKLDPQSAKHPGSLTKLPGWARQVADNYNHLHEQPTIFYAVCAVLIFAAQDFQVNIMIAWAYVGLRVLHSLVQATINVVALRFALFSLSTLALMALATHAVLGVFF
ncbi:MAG: MAPEG family protein [Caulobacterales bacterium]|jgi:hypothetical protein